MKRSLQIVLNILACLISLVFFTLLFFPLDSVISHYLSTIEEQTKGKGDWRVSVSSIDASLIFDTKFKDLKITQKDQEVFYAPKISVDASFFSLLTQNYNIQFVAIYPQAKLSGHCVMKEGMSVDLNFNNVSLKNFPYLSQLFTKAGYSVDLKGKVQGKVSLDYRRPEGQNVPKNAMPILFQSTVNLKIQEAQTDHLTIAQWGIDLPQMILSGEEDPLEIDVETSTSQILINRLVIPGPDFSLSANGSLGLDRNQSISKISLDGRFAFSEEISTKILFLATIEKQKGQDGFYPLSLRGTSKKPEIQIGDFELSSFLMMMSAPLAPDSGDDGGDDMLE